MPEQIDPAKVMAEHADHWQDDHSCREGRAARLVGDNLHCLPYRLAAEHATLREQVQRVRELHRPGYKDPQLCAECTCVSGVRYPCPTIRALDGDQPKPETDRG